MRSELGTWIAVAGISVSIPMATAARTRSHFTTDAAAKCAPAGSRALVRRPRVKGAPPRNSGNETCLCPAVTCREAALLTFVLALAGCADAPTVDMSAAELALDQAQVLASHYAAPELAAAKGNPPRAAQALARDAHP